MFQRLQHHARHSGKLYFDSAQELVNAALEKSPMHEDGGTTSFLQLPLVTTASSGPVGKASMLPSLHCECTFQPLDNQGAPAVSTGAQEALDQAQALDSIDGARRGSHSVQGRGDVPDNASGNNGTIASLPI